MWTSKDENGRYEIHQDQTVGYYIYRYNSEGICTHDYLQDTLDGSMNFADHEFGLIRNHWKEEPGRV